VPKEMKKPKKGYQIHCLVRQEAAILTASLIFLGMGDSFLLLFIFLAVYNLKYSKKTCA
jgi:hypothetical protein